MFVPRRGMHARAAAAVSSVFIFATLLPQSTVSATPRLSLFILFETLVPSAPCSNAAAIPGPAPVAPRPTETLLKMDCESTAPDAIAHEATPRDSALLHSAGPDLTAPTAIVRTVPGVDDCKHANSAPVGCKNYEELVKTDLAALGKNGQKLLRAREKVLAILREPNSCSAWFQSRDPQTSEIFQTLNFFIDRKSVDYIAEVKQSTTTSVFYNPYVARVIQDGGSYQTVTINAQGAFFQPQAAVLEYATEGGPPRLRGPHALEVGPYLGGSMAAQVVTFLHELGHVIGLLPHDQGDVAGKSVQNTYEVLRYCRSEIESPPKRGTFSASR